MSGFVDNSLIDRLINALRCLPGVGQRTAQRLAFYLLQYGRAKGIVLADTLKEAIQQIGHCKRCNTFTELDLCDICKSQKRSSELLCIVESPVDVVAIEQTATYNGFYFVLMGHLSPLDGIGPNEIGFAELRQVIAQQKDHLREIILATNPTVEGEATAHYIVDSIKGIPGMNVNFSRIAHGIPMGSELEYIDANTLARAINGRINIK
jgi:recombination protein RecR